MDTASKRENSAPEGPLKAMKGSKRLKGGGRRRTKKLYPSVTCVCDRVLFGEGKGNEE